MKKLILLCACALFGFALAADEQPKNDVSFEVRKYFFMLYMSIVSKITKKNMGNFLIQI